MYKVCRVCRKPTEVQQIDNLCKDCSEKIESEKMSLDDVVAGFSMKAYIKEIKKRRR